jgi:hypothetical protein
MIQIFVKMLKNERLNFLDVEAIVHDQNSKIQNKGVGVKGIRMAWIFTRGMPVVSSEKISEPVAVQLNGLCRNVIVDKLDSAKLRTDCQS